MISARRQYFPEEKESLSIQGGFQAAATQVHSSSIQIDHNAINDLGPEHLAQLKQAESKGTAIDPSTEYGEGILNSFLSASTGLPLDVFDNVGDAVAAKDLWEEEKSQKAEAIQRVELAAKHSADAAQMLAAPALSYNAKYLGPSAGGGTATPDNGAAHWRRKPQTSPPRQFVQEMNTLKMG